MRQIIELTIDRTTLKSFSEGMYEDVKGFQDALFYALGELSWKSLQGDEKQLLLRKVSTCYLGNFGIFTASQ